MKREDDFIRHWVSDGHDTWSCACCETVFYDEDKVVDHPQNKGEFLCLNCMADQEGD